ncbi:MAG: hypothetical protein ABEK03_09515 [Candidatus Bipolaricaulia bacterium]
MIRRSTLMICAIAVAIGPLGDAIAQPPSQHTVRAQVAAGTVGSAIAGVGTYLGVHAVCDELAEDGPALYCIIYGMGGYAVALPLGAAAGVRIAASIGDVEGNTWLSILGALGGEAGGLLAVRGVGALLDDPGELYFLLAYAGIMPLASGAGAAWGFNAGT